MGIEADHPLRQAPWKHATFGKAVPLPVQNQRGLAPESLRLADTTPPSMAVASKGLANASVAAFYTNAVDKTVEHVVAARLHEDLDYHPVQGRGENILTRCALLAYATGRRVKPDRSVRHQDPNQLKRRPGVGRVSRNAPARALHGQPVGTRFRSQRLVGASFFQRGQLRRESTFPRMWTVDLRPRGDL